MLAFSTVPTPIGRLLQPWVCKGGAVPFDTKHADAFSVFGKERSQFKPEVLLIGMARYSGTRTRHFYSTYRFIHIYFSEISP